MKFKILIIIFNIVLFFSFITVFFLPFFYVDMEFMKLFWSKNVFFIPVFIGAAIAVNYILFHNKKIVGAIESEDWPALAMDLEEKLFEKKQINFKNSRLLLEALLLLSDFNGINRLEKTLLKHKPDYVQRLSREFAAAKLISQDFTEVAAFCRRVKNGGNTDAWIQFYTGVAELRLGHHAAAKELLIDIALHAPSVFLQVLAAYMGLQLLAAKTVDDADKKIFLSVYEQTHKRYTEKAWKQLVEKETKPVYALVFANSARHAGRAVYKKTG